MEFTILCKPVHLETLNSLPSYPRIFTRTIHFKGREHNSTPPSQSCIQTILDPSAFPSQLWSGTLNLFIISDVFYSSYKHSSFFHSENKSEQNKALPLSLSESLATEPLDRGCLYFYTFQLSPQHSNRWLQPYQTTESAPSYFAQAQDDNAVVLSASSGAWLKIGNEYMLFLLVFTLPTATEYSTPPTGRRFQYLTSGLSMLHRVS